MLSVHRPRRVALARAFLVATAAVSALPLLTSPALARQQPAAAVVAPAAGAKKAITHDVYDTWRSINGATLSRDGATAVYALTPQDGDGEFVARSLATGRETRHPRGGAPLALTADGRFAVFTIAPAKAEVEKARKAKKPAAQMPKNALGILNVATGKVEVIERVRRFALAEDGPRFLAYVVEPEPPKQNDKKPAAEGEKKEGGDGAEDQQRRRAAGAAAAADAPPAELVVRDLTTGQEVFRLAEADAFSWNKAGTRIAYARAPKKKPEDAGVFVREVTAAGAPSAVTLASGKGTYKALTWDEKGERLAFLSAPDNTPAPAKPTESAAEEKKDDAPAAAPKPPLVYSVRLWKAGQTAAEEVVNNTTRGLPEKAVVSDADGSLRFTRDGKKLFFGFRPAPKAPRAADAPEPVRVDVWGWQDPYLQPAQKSRAAAERSRDYAAVWHLGEKRAVALADPAVLPSVPRSEFAVRYVLGSDDTSYRRFSSWDRGYSDLYIVDLNTGARRKVREKHAGYAALSPDEKWLLFWETAADDRGGRWMIQDAEGKRPAAHIVLPTGAPTFASETQDTPSPLGPYGVAGWTEGDKSVLLYDRFDVWEAFPGSSKPARRLTRGRENKQVHRYVRLDPEERQVLTSTPLILSLFDEGTKASGYARMGALKEPAPATTPLVMLPKRVAGLEKAKDADTVLFTVSTFEEYPNLWTAPTLSEMPKMQRISDANPQQAQYRWGKAELISFTSEDGVPLQATLIKPEGFDPTKKYPLLINIYERMSDGLHGYTSPAPGTSINRARYVSNGYVILQPDIVYTTGFPGQSAMKCVLPAIRAVTQKGYIDEKRIGIQGHSWGGYEITYMITRTNVFRAVEAGASVANMSSAYGGIRWGAGISRAFQYERGQSRIGGTPWDKTREYIENSPIFWADRVQTPYLTIHNDEDDAVPWEQGIEFFTALRRLGKEAYLFNYNGEVHNLRGRDNQKHWTVHMAEFFDHHLLGAPRPEWMEKGVPFLERGERDLVPFYGKPVSGASTTAGGSAGEEGGGG